MSHFGAAILIEPGDWRQLGSLSAAAEAAGWDYILCAEGPFAGWTNSIVGSAVMAENTERMTVGTCISIVDYRHPWTAAAAAGNLRERTGGRYVMGFGVSHPAINGPLGIVIDKPLTATRRYVAEVRRFADTMPWGQPEIWLAAVLEPMVRLAAGIADGIILHHVPLRLIPRTIAIIEEEAAKAGRPRPKVISYARTALHEDIEESRRLGRDLTLDFYRFPVYQKLFRHAGFVAETDAVVAALERDDDAAALAAISDELLDDYILLGDVERCRAKLAEFEATGIDVLLFAPLPIRGVSLLPRFTPLFAQFGVGRATGATEPY